MQNGNNFCSKIQLTSQATTYLSFAPDRILNLLKFFCGRSFKFAFMHPINNALKLAFRVQGWKFPRKRSRIQNISPWYCQDLNLKYLLVSSKDNIKIWGDLKWNFQFYFLLFLIIKCRKFYKSWSCFMEGMLKLSHLEENPRTQILSL